MIDYDRETGTPILYARGNAMNLEWFTTACPFKKTYYTNKPLLKNDTQFIIKTPINEETAPYIRYFDIERYRRGMFDYKECTEKLKEKYKLDENKIDEYKNTIGKEVEENYDKLARRRVKKLQENRESVEEYWNRFISN